MEYVVISDEEIEAPLLQQQQQELKEKEERERQEQKSKLYSYIRWSSSKQTGNTSNDRQNVQILEIAKKHDLVYVDEQQFKDEAVSAFRSKNSTDGALATFLQAVKSGVIKAGSWLFVENLDRLSRNEILEAIELFNQIIRQDITIVTGMDGAIYNRNLINNEPYRMFGVQMLFMRAHEESATKSKRTRGNALAMIRRHESGERSPCGRYARTIKSVGTNVWWIDDSSGYVKPHKDYAPIAKEILQMYLQGYGARRITNYLNEKYKAPKTTAKVRKWSDTYVKKLIKNTAVIGEKTYKIDGLEYTLKDYYPPIVDQNTWNRIQYVRKHKPTRGGKSQLVGLLTGIDVFKCGYCDSSFSFTKKNNAIRYICGGGNIGATDCNAWGALAEWIEKIVIRIACDKIWNKEIATESNLPALHAQLEKVIENKNTNMKIMLDSPSISLGKIIAQLEQQEDELKKQIDEEQIATAKHNSSVDWEDVSPAVLDFNNNEERLKVREMCKFTFKRITIKRYTKTLVKNPQKLIDTGTANPLFNIPPRKSGILPCLTWGNRKSNRYIYHLDIEFTDGERRKVITNGNYHYTDVKLLSKDAMKSIAKGYDTKIAYVDFFEHIQFK